MKMHDNFHDGGFCIVQWNKVSTSAFGVCEGSEKKYLWSETCSKNLADQKKKEGVQAEE